MKTERASDRFLIKLIVALNKAVVPLYSFNTTIDDTYNIVQEGYSQLSNNSVYSNVSTPFSSESSQVLATKSVIFSADDSALTGLRSLVLIVSFVF